MRRIATAGTAVWPVVAIQSGAMSTRGEAIRRARQRRKLRQEDLAEATGVNVRTIGRIETNAVQDSPGIAILEEFLGIDPFAAPEPIPASDIEAALEVASDIQLLGQLATRLARTHDGGARLGKDFRWPEADEGHYSPTQSDSQA